MDTAWKTTTGRPDVAISVLDSGIKWDDRTAMVDLRRKTRIDRGEAPVPQSDRADAAGGAAGSAHLRRHGRRYDANRDGVFNVVRLRVRLARGDRPDARAARASRAAWGRPTCSTPRTC